MSRSQGAAFGVKGYGVVGGVAVGVEEVDEGSWRKDERLHRMLVAVGLAGHAPDRVILEDDAEGCEERCPGTGVASGGVGVCAEQENRPSFTSGYTSPCLNCAESLAGRQNSRELRFCHVEKDAVVRTERSLMLAEFEFTPPGE